MRADFCSLQPPVKRFQVLVWQRSSASMNSRQTVGLSGRLGVIAKVVLTVAFIGQLWVHVQVRV